jgi:hypothetical protein
MADYVQAHHAAPRYGRFSVCRAPAIVKALLIAALTVCFPLAGARADEAEAALKSIKPDAIRADMRFLADDLLEGRGTASRGHEIAARYVASQLEGMGLKPAGENGSYFQEVPIRSLTVDEAGSSATLSFKSSTVKLIAREDYLLVGDPGRRQVDVEAPVVFAGYGITAPSQGYDDYKHIDAKGKIVAVLFGAPNFPTAVKAHYSASWLKRQNAAAHGAVGYLLIYDPALENIYPFKMQVRDIALPKRNWLDRDGHPNQYYPALKVVGVLSAAGAQQLFAGSGHTLEQVYAAAKKHKPPAFALAQTAHFHTSTVWSDAKSPNVVARLEGSDPALFAQYVVYSAHLDHLGISTPVDGDAIYNGALDNASGVAVLLEVARAFSGMPVKPKRSLLFLAVTGEEAGLLGSDYFASNPTVPKASMIADINMDEDVMLWPLEDVVALGAEHSTLGGVVERATQRLHLVSSPDPQPEQVDFIRSDQYSFVRQGIPAFSLSAGFKSEDPAIQPAKIMEDWDHRIYHHPQDDMQQPGLNFGAAALYAQTAFLCGLITANDANAPSWNPGDFFGIAFAPSGR